MKITFDTTLSRNGEELPVICEVLVLSKSAACDAPLGNDLECEILSVVADSGPEKGKEVETTWSENDEIRSEAAARHLRR